MRLPTGCRFAFVAAIGAALSICQYDVAHAQSLFNNRAPSGGSQASTTAATSLFGNIGFPQPANFNAMQRTSGSFVGRSNRGFVGSRAANQSSTAGGENGNANRSPTGLHGSTGSQGEGGAARSESASSSTEGQREASSVVRRTRIIPRHRIAFDFPARPVTEITSQLTTQLANLADTRADFAQIKVLAEPNGLVKLQGRVPTDDTRKLVAILVGLEPGVRGVQNELLVGGNGN